MSEQSPQRIGARRKWILGTALVVLVLVAYIPSFKGEFLWDDDSNVTGNQTLRDANGLFVIWASPFANQQFYPLTHTSFWVEYQLWELWPTGFRLTNALLHGLVAVTLWTGLRRLAVPGAWVAAAIFALHPVQVESVAWITERKNLLSALFYLLALLSYLRYSGLDGRQDITPRRRRRAYAATLVRYVLMLLSKTAFLTLPVSLLVLVWWKRGRITRRDVLPTLPLFGLAALFGVVTAWLERQHVGTGGVAWELSWIERLIVVGRAFWFYATKTILPVGLNFIYPRWTIDATVFWQYLFPLSALALLVLLWWHREKIGRGPLAGVVLFVVALAPALGFIDFYFQIYSFVQDHFQYLAVAAGVALVVALLRERLGSAHGHAPAIVAAIVLLLLGGMTWQRSKLFVSKEVLWTSVLERNPGAWMADINLGIVYEEQGRIDEAIARYNHALVTPNPEQDKAHYNLGRLFQMQGRAAAARSQYEFALVVNPSHANAQRALANLMRTVGDQASAIEAYLEALEDDPESATLHFELAEAYASQGQTDRAEQHYVEAARLDPSNADAHDRLGRLLDVQGRHRDAVIAYKRALRLDPARPEIHYNLGLIHEQSGDNERAEQSYRNAIDLDPDLPPPHNNLAIVLYNTGRYEEAWAQIRRYEELGGAPHPDFLNALTEAAP